MYRVVRRTGDIFGDEPHVCEFVCDTSDDVATLPTSIVEGTGGKSKYDNQKCSAGSTAIIATNSGSNSYILNNSNVWIAQSSGSSGSGSGSSDPSENIDPRIYPLDTNGLPTGDVIVTEGIKSFGSNGVGNYGPFYKNPNITSVTLPDSMEIIGNSVFYECSKLKTIKWPKNCKIATIDQKAFYNVPITVINIPDSVTAINGYAFYNIGCTSINFGNASVELNSNAFHSCKESIINFGIGNIKIVGSSTFNTSIYLASISIPGNVHFTSNAVSVFANCYALETVSFDENHEIETIPSNMFYNCSKLKSITFPKSLTTLGQYSFFNTGFETFTVPDGVTRLEQGCLSYMTSLTTVNIPSSVTYTYYYPGSNYDIFQRSNAITTVNLGEDFTAELSLATQTLITQECVADIASKLHDYTGDTNAHRICFNAAVYDAIPEDVMAVFTGKNWTVARSTST